MTEHDAPGREGASNRWGVALRALRLRTNMKQEDAASRLQVSQSYVSRLENGVIAPSAEVIGRLKELLHNPVQRPLLEQLRAIVRYAPHAVALLAWREGRVSVIEASERFRQAQPPFDSYRPGMKISDPVGREIDVIIRSVLEGGAFDGEIACMEQVWRAEQDGELRHFRSVQTPVFAGAEWLIHSATALISETTFERFTRENGGPEKVHHF